MSAEDTMETVVQFVDTPVAEAASVTLDQALEALLAPVDGEQRLVRNVCGLSLLRRPRRGRRPSIYIRVPLPGDRSRRVRPQLEA